jgi:hypothetical protein
MKTTILILICTLSVSLSVIGQDQQAQKFSRWYANLGIGGGVSTSSTFSLLYDLDMNSTNPSVSVHPVGLGNGFNGYATVGFRFSKYLAVEVGANEFVGLPVGGDSVVNLFGSGHAEAKILGRMFSIVPAIVISAGLDKINPYARFGLLVGAFPTMITRYIEENDKGNPATSLEIDNQYYGGVALGYVAAGGVSFKLSKLISVFTEVQFSHATWSPDHSEITKYTVYELDKLSTLTPYEKQVDFVSTKYFADPKNSGSPRKELRMTVPFSTFAANVGVSFNF